MAATAKGVLKPFHQNLGKTPVKKLIFLNCRLEIYSFTKTKVIHRCSSRILDAPSFEGFTDSHFQVGSFIKHLLWHQNYFDLDESSHFQIYSPLCLTHPLIMRFFQPPPPSPLNILKTHHICKVFLKL